MSRIGNKIKPFLKNIRVAFYTRIHKRNKKVVLIGAWMGEKFADNSRYLYQYLFENRKELNLERIIWVTRSHKVNDLLNSIGYESYLIGTPESKYWHLKAGIHILCNMAFPQSTANPDIDTRYSWGAVKFQLWHGVGMKSVGAASNQAHSLGTGVSRFHNSKLASWCTPGGWNEEYFLSTSKRNAEVNYAYSLCLKDHLFISSYPRNCKCLRLLPEERAVIEKIKKYKKVIGYFPTFRSDYNSYIHPLSDSRFLKYLKDKEVLWVEKPHSADRYSQNIPSDSNMLLLDKNFDMNVLFDLFDVVISDYSSVVFDCVYKDIPVIMYCPDLDLFKNGDVGFLFDIESYCEGIIAKTMDDCVALLDQCFMNTFFSSSVVHTYSKIRRDYFDDRKSDYYQIWKDMIKIVDQYYGRGVK